MLINIGGSLSPHEIDSMSSVSYRSSVSSPVAEYHDLLNGYVIFNGCHIQNIHVIGDSQIIINQLNHRRLPKKRLLQGLCMQCRLLADRIGVLSWTHQLQQHSCMADALACHALETGRSIQLLTTDTTIASLHSSEVGAHLQSNADHCIGHELDRCSTRRQHNHENRMAAGICRRHTYWRRKSTGRRAFSSTCHGYKAVRILIIIAWPI